MYQQDGALAHNANVVQGWMEASMKFWTKSYWAPQSPDLNLLDFSIWWHIERKACAICHSNVDKLKAAINKEWAKMSKAYITKTFKAFRDSVEAILKASRGQIHKKDALLYADYCK